MLLYYFFLHHQALNLTAHQDFDTITTDPQAVADLRAVYKSVEEIDPYIGGLLEGLPSSQLLGASFIQS